MADKKYVRIMKEIDSNGNGYPFKLNEINETDRCNTKSKDPKEFGGFNFTTEDKALRWTIRGNTLYEVEIPTDAKTLEIVDETYSEGIYKSNKIIIKNPKELTENIIMDLYKKSDLPETSYFQCLAFLALRNYKEVCRKIIKDKVTEENVKTAIKTFKSFLSVSEKEKTDCYKEVEEMLEEIKDIRLINQFIDREPYIKQLTDDKIINLTGESGAGKSYYSQKYNTDEYLIIDTDQVFGDYRKAKGINRELNKMLRNKYKELPNLCENFDKLYKDIIKYLRYNKKTIVIDSAQFRNIKDYSILKGQVIIIRTSIDTCYKRCLQRYKQKNNNIIGKLKNVVNTKKQKEDYNNYKTKKLAIYKWYKAINKFIKEIDNIEKTK